MPAQLRRSSPLILSIAVTVTLVCGVSGTLIYAREDGRSIHGLDLAYYMLQIFVLEAGLDTGKPIPWPLSVARIVGPAVTGYAALWTVIALLGQRVGRLRLRFFKGHVVVCGLSPVGAQVASQYRTLGDDVVVITDEPASSETAACRDAGAVVLTGRPADPVLLRQARVEHGRIVFATSGRDCDNLEIVLRVSEISDSQPSLGAPRELVEIEDVRLAALASRQRSSSSGAPIDLRVLRPTDLCARLLFSEHPLDHRRIGASDRSFVHLVVAGFGRMGQSLALQACKIGHFANGLPLRITVVDRDTERAQGSLLAAHPSLPQVAHLTFERHDADSAGFVERIAEWSSEENSTLTVALCLPDAATALATALSTALRVEGLVFPIHVRLGSNASIVSLLEQHASPGGVRPSLHAFGDPARILVPAMLEDEQLDHLARTIHEAYRAKRRATTTSDGDPSVAPWERLDVALKDSCRQQADHIPVKLRAVGCETAATDDTRAAERVTQFTSEERTILSRVEHARWNAERLLAGWRLGPKKDVRQRITPYLVSWDDLPPEIQRYDTEAIDAIPSLVETMGMSVYRRSA